MSIRLARVELLWLVSIYGGKFLLASTRSTCMLARWPDLQERYLERYLLGEGKVSSSAGSTCERTYAGIILGNGVRLSYRLSLVLTHPRRSLGQAARGSNLGD